jgi:3-hydroxyacyl-CoA dehydrogenase
MSKINKVAVIGSGVMGSGIAAHIANSNTKVLLLDIVPEGAADRNQLAKAAVEKLKKADPAPLTHKSKLKFIEVGNLQEDVKKLGEVDWIIEVVLEDINIKHNTYKLIDANRKAGSIVSSNTSTIPLTRLVDGQSESFQKDFMITHFFNPPRYMGLLELVTGEKTNKAAIDTITEFCDVKLGKGVVKCNDTPGFIANRIGTFWIARALNEAIKQGTSVEVVDAVMSRPVGIPKTGVFGLMDLIGLDLLPLIAKSFSSNLAADDEFNRIFQLPDVVKKLIETGYTGRKGKGGFYRLKPETTEKIKETVDLSTGEFRPTQKARLASVDAAKKSVRPLVEGADEGAKFAWPVLRDVLVYTANLVGVIAKDIADIDEAMKLGYNWKYGPFELVDRFAEGNSSGVKYFVERLKADGIEVPAILAKAGDGPLYKVEDGVKKYFTLDGYKAVEFNPDAFKLEEIKLKSKPIIKNPSAALWDIGDKVACLEFTSKMNSLDPLTLEMVAKSVDKVAELGFKGLVIANDSDNFSVGANIGVLLFAANVAAWTEIDSIIKQGQDAYMKLKYAPFPVVAAPSGFAFGGGCEILLHSDEVIPHVELYSGLVEVGVGIVPGWGGCKEIVLRHLRQRAEEDSVMAKFGGWFSWLSPVKTLNTMPAIIESFKNISTARVSKSAEEAKEMLIVKGGSETIAGITMNRKRVLANAKKRVIEMAPTYKAPETYTVNLPGKTARYAIEMALKEYDKLGKVTPHDLVVSRAVAYIVSGGETGITKDVTEQQLLDLEREAFTKLVKHKDTLARLEHMLDTGKPLRN